MEYVWIGSVVAGWLLVEVIKFVVKREEGAKKFDMISEIYEHTMQHQNIPDKIERLAGKVYDIKNTTLDIQRIQREALQTAQEIARLQFETTFLLKQLLADIRKLPPE